MNVFTRTSSLGLLATLAAITLPLASASAQLTIVRVNGGGAAPTDSWVTDVVTGTTFLWNFGLGIGNEANINATPYAYDATLAEWQAHSPNAVILGFSSGVGSGWGPFVGAVDNISWTIGGVTTMSNFELERATVPEPGSLALLGLALAGLAVARRRKGA